MTAYRPSLVVNFKLRFDEQLTVVGAGSLITQEEESESAPNVGGATQPNPDVATAPGRGQEGSWVMQRIPKEASLEKPGYRQAQKFDLVLDFAQLPIDPRTIAAALVEIHMGTVSNEDFARGFQGNGRDATGALQAVLRTRDDSNGVNENTLQMVGLVDEWEVLHGPDGSEVAISGRDLRGVLLDTPINAGATGIGKQLLDEVEWEKDINEVVTQILGFNTWFAGIQVVTNAQDWPNGVLPSPGLGKGGVLGRRQQGARKTKKGAKVKPPASTASLNFWDLIVRSCYLVGGIPYFAGTQVRIRPSATVYDRLRGPIDPVKNPTPFKGGKPRTADALTGETLAEPLRTRRLVYGRDTESIRLMRTFAGWRKPKVIRTISIDMDAPDIKSRLLVGRWPPKTATDANKTAKSPGKRKPKEEVLTVPVPGVTDVEQLTTIAHSIYEEYGRGEVGGEVVTPNLSSFGGSNTDPDLLRLEPGDGVEFLVDTQAVRSGVAPVVSTYTNTSRRSFNSEVKEATLVLGDADLARVVVATARGQVNELQNYFRVQNVKYQWDSSAGIKLSFDFQNYIVARAQVEDASASEGTATVKSPGEGGIGGGSPQGVGNLLP